MKQKFLVLARANKKDIGRTVPIYLRVLDGACIDSKAKTPFFVDPTLWDEGHQEIKIKAIMSREDRERYGEVNMQLASLRNYINQSFAKAKLNNSVGKNWLEQTLADFFAKPKELKFVELADAFLSDPNHPIADSRKKQYAVLFRSLQRYELYVRSSRPNMRNFVLDIREIDKYVLSDLWLYMRDEPTILKQYPNIVKKIPTHKKSDVRSTNTLAGIFKRLRAFLQWCVDHDYLDDNPFGHFHIESELYGTPVYLTKEEVKQLYAFDFSGEKELEEQRDVFVFQCNLGCRVGDLLEFKKGDVVGGFINYIPNKTLKENARTVSVPLNETAMAIIKKYEARPGEQLLPFVRSQYYNNIIKETLRRAGITRQVVVLDPVSRTEKKVSIASIASSHMARRTFIGNIYKNVKDPNLVSSLTGHVEGSRAFTRYRAIDDDMKKELVKIIG